MKFLYPISVAILAALTINTSYAQQVCNSNTEVTTPSSRFELSAGEALDTKTGLIWKRCFHGQSWNEETRTCSGQVSRIDWKVALETASNGWRVPNIKELGSIVEHSCANPSINLSVFPGTAIAPGVWSSTPTRRFLSQPNSELTWVLRFQDGTAAGSRKNSQLNLLLVKDADVVPVPVIEIAH